MQRCAARQACGWLTVHALVPNQGMVPGAGMLKGEALTEDVGGTAFVQSFSAADMPADPAQRFGVLFAARPRWQLAELQPYLAGLRVSPCVKGCLPLPPLA